jgi:hypothetical protein
VWQARLVGKRNAMAWDDEDDWVGEPPEGRHSRDRAKPEFWRRSGCQVQVAAGAVLLGLIVLGVVLLLS